MYICVCERIRAIFAMSLSIMPPRAPSLRSRCSERHRKLYVAARWKRDAVVVTERRLLANRSVISTIEAHRSNNEIHVRAHVRCDSRLSSDPIESAVTVTYSHRCPIFIGRISDFEREGVDGVI